MTTPLTAVPEALWLSFCLLHQSTRFTVCPVGYFGLNCAYRCYCKDPDDICDPVYGNCSSGCPQGWYGPGCIVGTENIFKFQPKGLAEKKLCS